MRPKHRSQVKPRPSRRPWLWLAAVIATAGLVATILTRGAGFSARRSAWPGETRLAQAVRGWTLPAAYRGASNPVRVTAESVRAGMEHWADHCATCHGNDGSGQTPIGQGLFPPAPDMRGLSTQSKSDGALFYAIEHGVPFTGMPAWGNGTSDGERASWELVLFVRRLPSLTAAEIVEMEKLNPKSAAQLEQNRKIQEFLKGGGK
jgi:mono/diheme cytochrome c family protein